MLKGAFISFLFLLSINSVGQTDTTQTLDVSLEFRPRFEFRNGYKQLPAANLNPAFFISSRSRLSFNFTRKKSTFHFSAQDVRVWGQNGNSPAIGGLGVFESYAVVPIHKNATLKIGRQAIELDNGRLFSRANWNQFSRAHDGIRYHFKHSFMSENATRFSVSSDVLLFYNQNNAHNFGTNYTSNFYKYLFGHYLIFDAQPYWTFKVLNAFDGYQSLTSENTIYVRGTSGGRIEYHRRKFKATVSGFYQYGQLQSGQKISAFYIQPEVSIKLNKFRIRAGAEYLSGDDALTLSTTSHSFSTLYGVAFKFMGHLNYFTSFPIDVNGGGLINPYLFFTYRVSNKWRIKLESHLFFTQNNTLGSSFETLSPFLAFEGDLKLKYLVDKNMSLDFGLSLMKATSSLGEIKSGDYTKVPVFSFLMFTWKPQLFHSQTIVGNK